MNGYNFTERVRKALALAREEAVALHHEYVGTEHILLGVLREGNGVAMSVLRNLNVDDASLRDSVIRSTKHGDPAKRIGPDLPYASRAKHVLEQAMSEARTLNHSYVGTEHLLLGLLRESRGLGAQVLTQAGVTLESARAETISVLGHAPPRSKNSNRHLPRSSRRIREIVSAAYNLANERGSAEVTPVHLAIALLEHGEGFAHAVLQRLNFDFERARTSLESMLPSSRQRLGGEDVIQPTPEAADVMDAADQLATHSRAPTASTQHLLLALLRVGNVETLFAAHGAALADVEREIARMTG